MGGGGSTGSFFLLLIPSVSISCSGSRSYLLSSAKRVLRSLSIISRSHAANADSDKKEEYEVRKVCGESVVEGYLGGSINNVIQLLSS